MSKAEEDYKKLIDGYLTEEHPTVICDNYIKELEEQNKWISVRDRLPEENMSVLACNMHGMCADEREPEIAYVEKNTWWRSWANAKLTVTHWMLLPKTSEDV